MNILWWVFRHFYVLGLVIIMPLFVIVANHFGKDVDVEIPVLIGCLAYFALGYVLFKVIPGRLKTRMLGRVARYKASGFTPEWEVESVTYNRYVGFDTKIRKALYVDVNDGTETLVDFDKVNSWELAIDKNKPSLLKLLTRIPSLPVINLRVNRRNSDEVMANLGIIFG